MKANELRIGNWIQYGTKFVVLKSFTRTDIKPIETTVYVGLTEKLKHYPLGWHEIEPIHLTEEWLEKFGFTYKRIYENRVKWYKGSFSLTHIFWEDEEPEFSLSETGNGSLDFYAHGDVPKTKHVHQLQNLYFALTGEELTIKE